MSTASHGQRETLLPREVHRRDDIRRGAAPEDRRRRAIDHAVPHSARLIVAGVPSADDGPVESRAE
jgi:hypothetical protein